jgi:D-psicose/D-tagatose/L-ribulose 3-epimerase
VKKGISLLLWTPFVESRHLPILAELAAMGYDGVEVPVAAGEHDAHYDWLGGELRELGLEATAVGFLNLDEDPASADPATRARAVQRLGQLARRAQALGAEILAGPVHEAYAHFPGPIQAVEVARAAESLAAGAELAADAGVRILIEPLNRFESRLANTIEQAAAIVRMAAHPQLGVVLDTHHAHLEADDLAGSICAVGPLIQHVQLSENHRGVPGSGQVDFAKVAKTLQEIGYEGWLVIEAFSRIDSDLGDLLHVWRGLADDWQLVSRKGLELIEASWT